MAHRVAHARRVIVKVYSAALIVVIPVVVAVLIARGIPAIVVMLTAYIVAKSILRRLYPDAAEMSSIVVCS